MIAPVAVSNDAWRSVRRAVLVRDGYRCRLCNGSFNAGELDVHHLMPRFTGGSDDPSNLVTLCDVCHGARHPNLQAGLARRLLERLALRLAKALDGASELAGVDGRLAFALRYFGVDRLRPAQLDVILAALRGESVLLVSPTGSGKSLCFQVPALLAAGTSIVVSPLRALMAEQVSSLLTRAIPATFINSDLSRAEKEQRYQLLAQGTWKFLYCAPERFDASLVAQKEVSALTSVTPAFLIIDEAHCIDRWGDDFRPAYGRLADARTALGAPPVLAFTATAGVDTQRRICDALKMSDARIIVTGVDRPNIAFLRLDDSHRNVYAIWRMLSAVKKGRAMIFVATVKQGELVCAGLKRLGVDVEFYHSQKDALSRDLILGRFTSRLEPALRVVVCTNAFGMGLDVPDVRLVIHWFPPACVEDYLQEFGRAGRDGEAAVSVLVAARGDARLLEFMASRPSPSGDEGKQREYLLARKKAMIARVLSIATFPSSCFREELLTYFGASTERTPASIALRIVRWLYTRKKPVRTGAVCCDSCHGRSQKTPPEAFIARVLGSSLDGSATKSHAAKAR